MGKAISADKDELLESVDEIEDNAGDEDDFEDEFSEMSGGEDENDLDDEMDDGWMRGSGRGCGKQGRPRRFPPIRRRWSDNNIEQDPRRYRVRIGYGGFYPYAGYGGGFYGGLPYGGGGYWAGRRRFYGGRRWW